MNRPNTGDTVAKNIQHLMDAMGWNVPKLEAASGVPRRTIYSILNRERKQPGVDTTDQIAQAFGLTGWHLLIPNLRYDLAKNGKLDALLEKYAGACQETQEYVVMILDRERAAQ